MKKRYDCLNGGDVKQYPKSNLLKFPQGLILIITRFHKKLYFEKSLHLELLISI